MRTSSRCRTGMRSRYGGLRQGFVGVDGGADVRRLLGDDFRVLDPLLRAIERLAQSRLLDRLQQVVDGIHFEGAHGVLVVGGDERDERHRLLLQHPHDADAVELRHLPVEQREIRSSPFRSIATASLPDAASPTTTTSSNDRRSDDQKRAGRPFVVGDDDSEARAHIATRRASASSAALSVDRQPDFDDRAFAGRRSNRQRRGRRRIGIPAAARHSAGRRRRSRPRCERLRRRAGAGVLNDRATAARLSSLIAFDPRANRDLAADSACARCRA